MSKLEFFHGVMGSGKGVYIAQMAYNTRRRGLTPVTMKPGIDTKGGNFIVSRIGTSVPVDIMAAQESLDNPETNVERATLRHLGELGVDVSFAHLIVDEVQFFSPQQVDQLYELADRHDLRTTCFGLKTDVYRRLFLGSQRLIDLAEVHEMQTAIRCAGCYEKPTHNGRYINGLFDIDEGGDVIKIDGADGTKEVVVYDVFCTNCYDEEVEDAKNGIRKVPKGI